MLYTDEFKRITSYLHWHILHSLQHVMHSLHCIRCACVIKMFGIFSAGLLKTHNLSFQDSESLQAVFDKDSSANVFRSHPRSVKSFYILCYKNSSSLTVFLSLSVTLTPSVMFVPGFPIVVIGV